MKITTLLLIFVPMLGSAQEVVSTQGDSYYNNYGSVDFTIGEVVTATVTDGNNYITQGFHQSSWHIIEMEDPSMGYEVIVFPNPAEDVLNIKTDKFEGVTYTLYDEQGRLIMKGELDNKLTTIEAHRLAAGSYSLVLSDEVKSLKTFRLIKTQ